MAVFIALIGLNSSALNMFGNLIMAHEKDSQIFEDPDTNSYKIPEPLHKAMPLLIASSRIAQNIVIIEYMDLRPDGIKGNFIDIFDTQGKRINTNPISIGSAFLINVNRNGELLFLNRRENSTKYRIAKYNLN